VASSGRCAWCGRRLPDPAPTGRPRTYCRRSCRQRAFEARRRLTELDWGEARIRELLERSDELEVVVAAATDVVEEMARDIDDDRPWDDDARSELVERLQAILGS